MYKIANYYINSIIHICKNECDRNVDVDSSTTLDSKDYNYIQKALHSLGMLKVYISKREYSFANYAYGAHDKRLLKEEIEEMKEIDGIILSITNDSETRLNNLITEKNRHEAFTVFSTILTAFQDIADLIEKTNLASELSYFARPYRKTAGDGSLEDAASFRFFEKISSSSTFKYASRTLIAALILAAGLAFGGSFYIGNTEYKIIDRLEKYETRVNEKFDSITAEIRDKAEALIKDQKGIFEEKMKIINDKYEGHATHLEAQKKEIDGKAKYISDQYSILIELNPSAITSQANTLVDLSGSLRSKMDSALKEITSGASDWSSSLRVFSEALKGYNPNADQTRHSDEASLVARTMSEIRNSGDMKDQFFDYAIRKINDKPTLIAKIDEIEKNISAINNSLKTLTEQNSQRADRKTITAERLNIDQWKSIQLFLSKHGYYKGSIDGNPGSLKTQASKKLSKTRFAIMQWQRKNEKPETGIPSPEEIETILDIKN